MSRILVVVLLAVMSFEAVSAGFATKPAAAYRTDRNDEASLVRLLTALDKAGVAVYMEDYSSEYNGYFKINGRRIGEIIVFKSAKDPIETLKHEAMHVAQWCNNDKRGFKSFGFELHELEVTSIGHAINHYEAVDVQMEAEAFTAARTNSLKGMAVTVEKYCLR